MKLSVCFRFAKKILAQPSTVFITCILIFGCYWLFGGAAEMIGLYTAMASPAEIVCTVSEENEALFSQIISDQSVRMATVWKQSEQQINYHGYSGRIILIGCSEPYLADRFGTEGHMPSGAMPYILLEGCVENELSDEEGEKFPLDAGTLNMQQANIETTGTAVRIWHVFSDTSEALYAYTTSENYDAIMNTDVSLQSPVLAQGGDSESMASDTVQPRTGEQPELQMPVQDEAEQPQNYLIELEHGFDLSRMESLLEQNGISTVGEQSETQQWESMGSRGTQQLFLAAVTLICAAALIWGQEQLWTLRHRPFADYVCQCFGGDKALRKMLRMSRILYVMLGLMGGGAVTVFISIFF